MISKTDIVLLRSEFYCWHLMLGSDITVKISLIRIGSIILSIALLVQKISSLSQGGTVRSWDDDMMMRSVLNLLFFSG